MGGGVGLRTLAQREGGEAIEDSTGRPERDEPVSAALGAAETGPGMHARLFLRYLVATISRFRKAQPYGGK